MKIKVRTFYADGRPVKDLSKVVIPKDINDRCIKIMRGEAK